MRRKIFTNLSIIKAHSEARDDAFAALGDAEEARDRAILAETTAIDNATIAQNSASSVSSIAEAVTAAQAQANALLGLGIGGSYIDEDGNLIMTYNADTVTGIVIDESGDLILSY